MPKHARDEFETWEEINERCFCYYCGKETPDTKALQDHQKAKHLQCTHCRKKLDSIGGLKVHIESVHKLKLEKVENALPDRESADGPEIYLMYGVPQEMLDAYEAKKRRDYDKRCYEYYRRTGNHMPGSEEARNPAKRVKVEETETPEQRKAKREAWIAQKRAEKAAKGAAKQEDGVANKNEPIDNLAAQQSYVALEPMEASNINPEPGSEAYPTFPPQNQYYPGYSASPPMGSLPVTMPPQQGYASGPGQAWAHSPTNYGQPPYQPPYPTPAFPQQPVGGFGYAGSPQGFPPQPLAGGASSSHHSTIKREPRTSIDSKPTIPAAPAGLPPKPSFSAPSYSKEAMDKFHAGHSVSQLKPYARTPAGNTPAADDLHANVAAVRREDTTNLDQAFGEAQDPSAAKISRELTDLLEGGYPDNNVASTAAESTQDAVTRDVMTEAAVTVAEPAEAAPAPPKDNKANGTRATKQKLSDDVLSWEEKKGKQPRYVELTSKKRREKRRNNTVVEPADSQAVTGNVADDLEQ